METADKTEIREKNTKEDLIVPLMIAAFLACAWFVYIHESRTWISPFMQVMSWIGNPAINYTPVHIEGLVLAFFATIEIMILGVVSSGFLLANEKSVIVKFTSALGLGFGLTGLVTIVLGIFGKLYRLPLNGIILLFCIVFLSWIFHKQRAKGRLSMKLLEDYFPFREFGRPPHFGSWSLVCLAVGVIFFFCFYHALLTVVVHWDATVYHAVMSVIMYSNNGIPLIAGPSVGIEMSANFPPLFSAIGAFYYTQIGMIEDFYLRCIPPLMGLLTVFATYKIGDILGGKKLGLVSALFLAMTPLFFRYSMYATSYSTLTFFCSISIMFMLLAIMKNEIRYWVVCGLFFGFALLTSYMALFLGPFFVAALIYHFAGTKDLFKSNIRNVSALVLSTLAIGGIWYARNWFLLGNPIYPIAYTVLGGMNIDPLIMETTINGIESAGTTCFFGEQASVLEKIFMFLIYRTHFPAVSLFTILGVALLLAEDKKLLLISVWPISLSAFVLSGITWAFPRHVVFALPGFALLSAFPIARALEKCGEYDRRQGYQFRIFGKTRKCLPLLHKSDGVRIGLALLLFAAFLFPSLTLSMGGKLSMDNHLDVPPNNYLWLLKNPNAEKWFVLMNLFPEGIAWKWLDENLKEGERVAAVENRIYHVKNSNNSYFFYLDGWEARKLYNITDPTLILHFLQKENIKYILDVAWARTHGHFDILPLTQYLGSVYFPKIVDCNGNPDIYNVGPVESPITAGSPTLVSINQAGWSEPQSIDGTYAKSVIAGNLSSRLLVATPNLTSIRITYLDVGKDRLSINLRNPYSGNWTNGYATIQKKDTGKWNTFEFLAPLIREGFAELAFYAFTDNFTIIKIEASPFQLRGRGTLNSLEYETTNMTVPPTLMVHLPLLRDQETVIVQSNSFGKKICIEVFDGVIQPWEDTEWWKRHELVVRSPNSATGGQTSPSARWDATKSGLYTLVIVPRERDWETTKVELQVSMGAVVIYEARDRRV